MRGSSYGERRLRWRRATPALLATLVLAGVACAGAADDLPAEAVPQASEDPLLRWPLPPGAERYGAIDGRRLHRWVVEQAEIARRHRDEVNPQFWGRIIGTWSDAASADWLKAKFDEIGLADARIQPLDLLPQWMPQSWEVEVTAAGETRRLESVQPFYRSAGTSADGLELEAVYVGLGTEADFAGRDVRGKAVFAYSMLGAPATGAVPRAADRGAAAVFDAHMLPGNMKYQAYPSGTDLPAFTIGGNDADLVRKLVTAAGTGPAPRVRIRLDVEMTPDLQTALVWGTLPGATDETIYVMAHRDGWFDAAGDNASGVASMLGLAEYYAALPQADRPRTLVFLGLDGHHNTGEGSTVGGRWLVDHRDELFDRTALVINAEHPSTVQTQVRARYLRRDEISWANTYMPQQWYAGGPSRPNLQAIAVRAFKEFGVSILLEPNDRPPAGDLGRLYRFTPGVATSEFFHYFHTDLETPETVPWTGLEATTRAYARIIDEVNRLPLSELQRSQDPVLR